ncbi:MAG: PAS domain S-box protein, partial [Proteobacteria bacterium]|nr:PAS domain S-box protein [Pseudomonadota bacterium]
LGYGSCLSAPISVDGAIYGILCFGTSHERPTPFLSIERHFVDLAAMTIGHVLGRHKSEEARRRVETRLRRNQLRQQAIMSSVMEGLINVDDLGKIRDVNPAMEVIFGYTRAEMVGQNVMLLMGPPHDAKHDSYMERYRRTGEQRVIGTIREIEARRKDGTVFPIELSVNETHDGEHRSLTGVIRDITERKEVERLKSEFVSTVSHELRTPLTSIRGALGLLEGGVVGSLPTKALSMVTLARTNSDRLIRLINDILDLEKLESGEVSLYLGELEPRDIVGITVGDLQAMADECDVHVELEVDETLPQIRGDQDRLIQVLTNLLGNALKFSPRDSTVVVRASHGTTGCIFAVEDQGPGISGDDQKRLFQKFQ